jgi:hypothetical protein
MESNHQHLKQITRYRPASCLGNELQNRPLAALGSDIDANHHRIRPFAYIYQ